MSNALVDLYRDIVANVSDRQDLFSLSITSRALGYEAERCLYGSLWLHVGLNTPCSMAHFLLLGRVAHHVRELIISGFKRNDSSSVTSALQSVRNLERLTLQFGERPVHTFLRYCPPDPPFQLRQLGISGTTDAGFITFAQTQRRLTTFRWYPGPIAKDISFSPSNFPALTSLSSPFTRCVLPLLPQLYHLNCSSGLDSTLLKQLTGTTFGSIRSLDAWLEGLDLVASIFPNIRFLEGAFNEEHIALSGIEQFAHLQKLRIRSVAHPKFEDEFFWDLPSQLFTRHNTLHTVEIWVHPLRTYPGIIFQRGISEPIIQRLLDVDEWLRW